MNTFDTRCTVGRYTSLHPGDRFTAGHLLEDMDHHGVAEALVLDSLSRETHPDEGNPRILDVAAASPRLHPVWSALPTAGDDEQPDPETLRGQMRERGVAALFLFPRQYRFNLQDWCIDPFIAPFAEAKVPVFLDCDETGPGMSVSWDSTDWTEVVAMCKRWPGLRVIVSEGRIRRAQRVIYRALDACPNLRIEVSGLWLHRSIEYITEHWGAERLVFGSHWPSFGQHMTVATLATADISDSDRQKIAEGNVRELISWNRTSTPVPVRFPKPADEFIQFGVTGHRPGSMTFLDCHGHIGGKAAHYHLPRCTLDGIVRDLDRFGVEKNIIFAFTGVSGDETFGNDTVAEAVRRYPERLIGFTLLNPHRGPDEMRKELERGAARGLRGVKLIPYYQEYPEEGPNIDAACRWAHEHKQIILNHYWGSAAQLDRLITTWPDACYFTGHCTTEYADIMKRHKNLYVCSCPLLTPRACEEVVSAIGADRLLFGSDLQDLPIAWGLGPILFARIPAADKRLILGETLRGILKRYSLRASTGTSDASNAPPSRWSLRRRLRWHGYCFTICAKKAKETRMETIAKVSGHPFADQALFLEPGPLCAEALGDENPCTANGTCRDPRHRIGPRKDLCPPMRGFEWRLGPICATCVRPSRSGADLEKGRWDFSCEQLEQHGRVCYRAAFVAKRKR